VAARRGPRQPDPDLDWPLGSSPIRLDPYFEQYQRLVSNPFLALAALVPWFAAMRYAFQIKNGLSILFLAAALGAIGWLLQFHCRDCGATGALFRWRRHACELALARQRTQTHRRFRGPNPVTQTVLWGLVVLVMGFLASIVLLL